MNSSPIIVALDFEGLQPALDLAQQLSPELCRLKVGKELFTACGPRVVSALQELGFDIFLDLKFHDIPNTVARAVQQAAQLGVWMVNVHASGGHRMMQAAVDALSLQGAERPLLTAVTVLTSMTPEELAALGVGDDLEQQVVRLAQAAQDSGLAGVVCSAQEAALLRQTLGPDFMLVTPGIRPEWAAAHDQQRIVTPQAAIDLGSDYLVVGRPITQAKSPLDALQRILDTLV